VRSPERGRAPYLSEGKVLTKIFIRYMKIEYLVPEMEVLEIKYSKMLCASGDDEPVWGGDGDPDDNPPS
jgi:hypothetical protein